MSQVFKTTKYSDYLGEERPLLDIYVRFDGPIPSPSVSPTISPTPSFTPTLTVTPTVTPSLNSSPTPTPSMTSTPTLTPTPSSTPPISEPLSITFSGNGDFSRYNGTYVLTQPVGKLKTGQLVASTYTQWSWSSGCPVSIGCVPPYVMLYNTSNILEVFHGGNSFVTMGTTQWATTYPAGPLITIARTVPTPYFAGGPSISINGLLWPSPGTFNGDGIYTGQITITYNY